MPYGTGPRRASCPTRTWSGMRQRSPSGAAGSPGWPVPWSRASGIPETSDSYPCPCCRGAQWLGAPPATDRQARSWRWMFLMGAANITPAPRASAWAWAADSGVSSPWLTIRPLPFLPWSSGLPGSAWLVRRLSCPGSGVAGAWRTRGGLPGRAWWTFGQKNTRPGEGAQATVQRTGAIAL